MSEGLVRQLIARRKRGPGGTYSTWFLWEERLKNFRSIRRGIGQVAREIADRRFGNACRGSSLETVVGSIAEQRQIFRGADHAFLWKPKLRQSALLHPSDDRPAVQYRDRQGLQRSHGRPGQARTLGSLPCDAEGDPGNQRESPPAPFERPRGGGGLAVRHRYRKGIRCPRAGAEDDAVRAAWSADLVEIREERAASGRLRTREIERDRTHTEVQGWLRDMGRALGYAVWIAANVRGRSCGDGLLSDGSFAVLPEAISTQPGAESARLIDVLWIDPDRRRWPPPSRSSTPRRSIPGSFALSTWPSAAGRSSVRGPFLVAPDARQDDVRQQLMRPAFRRVSELGIRYVPYGELARQREPRASARRGDRLVLGRSSSRD